LVDERDPSHGAVTDLRRKYGVLKSLWVTTDYVLDEFITRVFSRQHFDRGQLFCERLFQSEKDGLLSIERITPDRFQRAWELRLRHRDKPRISFTDLTSFAVMRELGIRHALTADNHYSQVHLGFQILP
jgi:predicted nucleic acid-binding protein